MSTGRDCDVVVVGAGPAGCSAAYELAGLGLRVIMLEKETIPRYKTCGGGIIGVTSRRIPAGWPRQSSIVRASFTAQGRQPRLREATSVFMQTVDRAEFDQWMAEAAVARGTELLSPATLKSANEFGGRVEARLDSGRVISADYLIDASGANSRCAHTLGVRLKRVDLGLEVELDNSANGSASWDPGRIHIDWGEIPGSYGWVFPKENGLTVGVIAERRVGGQLEGYLGALLRQQRLGHLPVVRRGGHLTRSRAADSPLGSARVLLVGDSAGLLEPWTREGISFAVRSGQLAARAVFATMTSGLRPIGALQLYERYLELEILPEMRAGLQALEAFEKSPTVFHQVITSGLGWFQFQRMVRGDTTIARAASHPVVGAALAIMSKLPPKAPMP